MLGEKGCELLSDRVVSVDGLDSDTSTQGSRYRKCREIDPKSVTKLNAVTVSIAVGDESAFEVSPSDRDTFPDV